MALTAVICPKMTSLMRPGIRSDNRIVDLLRMMHRWGDSIAIYGSSVSQLAESFNWLRKWNIPFDVILVLLAWIAAVIRSSMC